MEINRSTLDKIAHLSRLEFDDSESEQMIADMTEIITWVEKLGEVDTTNIAPLVSMSHEINVFRTDAVTEHLSQDRVFSQAPNHADGYFRVPKVIN